MHPALGPAIPALVVAHLASALVFALLHVPPVVALFAVGRERDAARVRRHLDRSRRGAFVSTLVLALLALSGAALASAQHVWSQTWVWGSVVVFLATSLAMSALAARAFNEARYAAGLPWFDGRRLAPAGEPDAAALERALRRIRARVWPITLIGLVGSVLLVWLMVARPT